MLWGDSHARTNRRAPSAFAICDFCGDQWNRVDLRPDTQWMGTELRPTGFLVCPHCLDIPQPQERALRIPPDPLPVDQPRVDNWPSGNQGFTQYLVAPLLLVPYTSKSDVLAAVAELSGIATPAAVTDQSTTILPAGTALPLIPAATRSWLLLYNPAFPPAEAAVGTVEWDSLSNVVLGPGEAMFWATAQGGQAPPQAAMTLIGLLPYVPFWCWDDSQMTYMRDGYGNLILDGGGNPIVA